VPEWNDRVDPNYDFVSDSHSDAHNQDPALNDVYMWEIFGINKVPFDGLLISRIVIENDKRKYAQVKKEGIHKLLRLPENFEIIGDCGAFGYVNQKAPPFDPLEMLEYYAKVGFNYGVSVDHLVVSKFEKEKDERIKITYDNGVKTLQEWKHRFRNDFQLILAIQGWEVSDYLRMYRDYVNLGATHLAFGGLARSPTVYIKRIVSNLISEIRTSRKVPQYLHFFGLSRPALFPLLTNLEELGVTVGFDSASYLRKAWLSAPSSQLNYLTESGTGYTAIRIPFVNKMPRKQKLGVRPEINDFMLKELEQECLENLRLYNKGCLSFEVAMKTLSRFNKVIGESPELSEFYKKTLEDEPWKKCNCKICRNIGIEVAIFRGNNRNRRRGFHNTWVFFNVVKNPQLWSNFGHKRNGKTKSVLSNLEKGENVLIITECTKQKRGYSSSTKTTAREMYTGRLFKSVKRYCEAMGFDYVIISAKYGLLLPEDIIRGYEKVLRTNEDITAIRHSVDSRLPSLIRNYDKIIVIAGEKYRKTLYNLWDQRFIILRSRGYGDLCSIIEKATPTAVSLLKFSEK
jgi:hypothetical protein